MASLGQPLYGSGMKTPPSTLLMIRCMVAASLLLGCSDKADQAPHNGSLLDGGNGATGAGIDSATGSTATLAGSSGTASGTSGGVSTGPGTTSSGLAGTDASTTISSTSSASGAGGSTASTASTTTVGAATAGNVGGGGGAASATSSTTSAGTSTTSSELGNGDMEGAGSTDEQYQTEMVSRSGVPYVMITNGWGPGFGSHTISWEGTSFVVENMSGTRGSGYEPASYPTVFCGTYSVRQVPECGLPASIDSLTSIRTGWRWAANGNDGEYNAAYDIWVGDGSRLQGYLMVWLRDPPENQPAGAPNLNHQGVTVANVPGVWNIWDGMVNNLPIINWVREEGSDSYEIEFDVMDFVRDAEARGLTLPGNSINAVAVGFEIWEGPITGLASEDFYVHVN